MSGDSGSGHNSAQLESMRQHGGGAGQHNLNPSKLGGALGNADLEEARKFAGALDKHMKSISGGENSDSGGSGSSSTQDHGRGGGADAISSTGPVTFGESSRTSMVDLVGGRNTVGRGGNDEGGRGL